MPSQWAVEMIQKVKLICGDGAAGGCAECLKGIEKIILEIDGREHEKGKDSISRMGRC